MSTVEAPNKPSVSELLAQSDRLQKDKQEAIRQLLIDRKQLQESTELRLKSIATELKALGYVRPRAANGTKAKAKDGAK